MNNDNPEWTGTDFKHAKSMKETMPEAVKALKRGRPKAESTKQHLGMRLDADIVAWLRSQNGYNALVNETLRQKMQEDLKR